MSLQERDQIKDRLRSFYALHPPDLKGITDINKRHFRFLLSNGRFYKIKDVIRSPADLQKWLVRLGPLDVYYSTSTYLNPTSVSSRPTKMTDYWGAGNIVLGNDLAFDLDRRPLSVQNLERARKDAVRLLELMVERGYRCKYVAFSGSKGFHLIFEDLDRDIDLDMHLREGRIIEKRRALVRQIASQGIMIDASVTVDTRRIIRLPGTINSKTGYCCQLISFEQLRSPVPDWLDEIRGLEGLERIPRFAWRPSLKQGTRGQDKGPDGGNGFAFTTFVTSSVLGTKGRHAVLASLPHVQLGTAIDRLMRAQEEYDLTDIYLFETSTAYQAVCLKTVQRNRYQKILDFLRSPSAGQLRRYGRVSLRMGPLVDMELKVLDPPARLIACLECPMEVRSRNYVSRGHVDFLVKHGTPPLKYPKVHGNGGFKLVDAGIRL